MCLHGGPDVTLLCSWGDRLQVALDIARAVHHLHEVRHNIYTSKLRSFDRLLLLTVQLVPPAAHGRISSTRVFLGTPQAKICGWDDSCLIPHRIWKPSGYSGK